MAEPEAKKIVDRYVKLKQIGRGSYGIVYKAADTKTDQVVALKKELASNPEDGYHQSSLREISILKELSHRNIVKLLDIFSWKRRLWLSFEFMESDLADYIAFSCETDYMELDLVKSYTFQILLGLEYAHSRRIMHCDLKPQNLLIDKLGCIKICDFGLSRCFSVPIRALHDQVGTLWYRAPELCLGEKRYTPAIDIWAVGCVMAEMINSKPLFRGDSSIDQLYQIFQILGTPNESNWPGVTKMPYFRDNFPNWTADLLSEKCSRLESSGLDLLSQMLTLDPNQRVSARSALKHPYFADIPLEEYISTNV